MRNQPANRSNLYIAGFALAVVAFAAALYAEEPRGVLLLAAFVAALATLPLWRLYVVIAAVSLPFSATLAAATPVGLIPLCDVAAVLAMASYCLRFMQVPGKSKTVEPGGVASSSLSVLVFAVPYFALTLLSVLIAAGSLPAAIQRTELVVVWVAFGALLYRLEAVTLFLRWFVGTCMVLSLAWIATPGVGGVLGIQKNPSGGFISAALIILVLSPTPNRYRLPGILVLCGGLLSTGSRGSLLGLAVAVALLLLFTKQWRRIFAPLVFAVMGGLAAFAALPESVTRRILSQDSEGAYNIDIRGAFVADALAKFEEVPWIGIGVGNYIQSDPALLSVRTRDPHNVYALSLAEGGYPLLAAFLLMVGGSLLWLMTKQKTWLVALAIAIQVSTLVHAFVDVYWVRGTPSVGWLAMGAAAAYLYTHRRATQSKDLPGPPKPNQARLADRFHSLVSAEASDGVSARL